MALREQRRWKVQSRPRPAFFFPISVIVVTQEKCKFVHRSTRSLESSRPRRIPIPSSCTFPQECSNRPWWSGACFHGGSESEMGKRKEAKRAGVLYKKSHYLHPPHHKGYQASDRSGTRKATGDFQNLPAFLPSSRTTAMAGPSLEPERSAGGDCV